MNLKGIHAWTRRDAALEKGNRSFFLRPSRRAGLPVLLLHGFSASPWEVAGLGRHLKEKGHPVFAPRLAGHGSGRAAFDLHGLEDWLADARQALALMQGPGRKPALIGHSGGGALATLLAAESPGKVSGIVLGAPAYRLANRFAFLTRFRLVQALKPVLDFNMPHADANAHWTLRYATDRVAELLRLGRLAATAARTLKTPLLMLQARGDGLVSSAFNERIFPSIPSPRKRLEVYETDEHNVFHSHNPHQARVFAWVDEFLDSL